MDGPRSVAGPSGGSDGEGLGAIKCYLELHLALRFLEGSLEAGR